MISTLQTGTEILEFGKILLAGFGGVCLLVLAKAEYKRRKIKKLTDPSKDYVHRSHSHRSRRKRH